MKVSRSVSSLDQQTRELTILSAIAEALNSSSDVRQALERTLALVADLFGLRTGWVWLLDPDTDYFYSAAVHNLPPYLQEPVRMTGKPCTCIQTFQNGKLAPRNIDVLACSRLAQAVQDRNTELTEGLRYHASIPLYFRDQPLGIMNVTSPTWRRLSQDELRLLSTVAYQVGIAIDRARLAEAGTRLARAEERARIAREIHDTLAQELTAITLHLEGALNTLERDPIRARERVERALAVTRQSLEDARRSVLNLRAAPLDTPLPEALSALGRAFTSETGVRVQVRADSLSLSWGMEGELYRIAQEALSNIRRHAQAREVEIALRGGPRSIRLSIRDDGQGFIPRAVAIGRYGILGMKERAKLLGGRMKIQSRPGEGTSLLVTVPLERDTP
ncbi:MAG: GAF domain-containing sensor histidine kinase [Chloroflexota bacterium]|nr:GAF domain-containing sensor histidine kinase [Chloroflexota bacterium]